MADALGVCERCLSGFDDFLDVMFHGICSPEGCFHCALFGGNGMRRGEGFSGSYVVGSVGVGGNSTIDFI